jgi:PAS domain S-box-containing protein
MRKPRLVLVGEGSPPESSLETKLRGLGYHIELITSSGQTAADSCSQLQPDLVLMAAVSHTSSGARTARRIRELCHVPVVFAAASTDNAVRDLAGQGGPDGFIVTDSDDSSLRNTIDTAIDRYHADALLKHRLAVEQAVVFAFQLIIGSKGLAGFYVLKALGEAISADCAQILELAADGSGFTSNCAWYKDLARTVQYDAIRPGIQALPQVLADVMDAKPVTVSDIGKLDPNDADILRACVGDSAASAVIIPIVSANNDLLGFMCFGYDTLIQHPDHNDMQSLCAVGNVLGIYTDYRLTEDSLAQSEKQFRRTFENAGIGMAIVDAQARIMKANRQLEQMLGYEHGQLEGSSMIELTHPDDGEIGRGKFWDLINSREKRYQIEKRYMCRDGRMLWTDLTMTVLSREKASPTSSLP